MIHNYRKHIGLTKDDLIDLSTNLDLKKLRLYHFKFSSINQEDINRARLITFNYNGNIIVLKSKYKEIKLSI